MSAGMEFLSGLALSRGDLDRAGALRSDPSLLARLLADPTTRVAVVRHDTMVVSAEGELTLRSPVPQDRDRLACFLGLGDAPGQGAPGAGRTAYVAVIEPTDPTAGWQTLRQAGARLGERDAGIFTTALALANWHRTHGHCARCGAPTDPVQAGWVRRCASCGGEHFPRTDPAVIMSVVDDDERLLLGRGLSWPPNQYSVLAGFVEPGESFEAAVAREVLEESGVLVTDVRYLGNQPWPFPTSIMIGVTARAVTTRLRHDPDELAEVRWVTRAEYAGYLRDGSIRVPGGISIARRLIERWVGAPLEQVAGRAVVEGFRPR
ncbi:MAG: NAD(+) diphosphatase [Dermatophilaceae bacterium]